MVAPSILGKKSEQQEPYIRLLVCRTCRTIEEIPPFDGPPEHDVLLQISAEAHGETHVGLIYNVAALHWHSETMRASITEQIRNGSPGLDAFGAGFYESRMTFHEDAMKCFNAHSRPQDGCGEFRGEHKRLKPGTDQMRKELGLAPVDQSTGPKVYLCDFCPVRSTLSHKQNVKRGLE